MRRGFSLSRAILLYRGENIVRKYANAGHVDPSGRALANGNSHGKMILALRPVSFVTVSIFAKMIALTAMRRSTLQCVLCDFSREKHRTLKRSARTARWQQTSISLLLSDKLSVTYNTRSGLLRITIAFN